MNKLSLFVENSHIQEIQSLLEKLKGEGKLKLWKKEAELSKEDQELIAKADKISTEGKEILNPKEGSNILDLSLDDINIQGPEEQIKDSEQVHQVTDNPDDSLIIIDENELKDIDDLEEISKSKPEIFHNDVKIDPIYQRHYLWLKLSQYGTPVEGTNIIPSQTFLLNTKWDKMYTCEEDQYDIISCLTEHKQRGIKIGLIVDLTCTQAYYQIWKAKKYLPEEFQDIDYFNYPLDVSVVPRKSDLNKLYDVLNKNAIKDFHVLVHCFSGGKRTGYLICYFLGRRYGIKAVDSIARFEKARGLKFTNKFLIDDLKEKFP